MYTSPSHLSETARAEIAETLNARLVDGLDLHSQIKVAHWNIKGPQFASLHPLFETFAVSLANHNDSIAERAVTLGARVTAPCATWRRSRASRSTRRRPPRDTRAREAAGRPHRDLPRRAARVARRRARSTATPTRSTC